MSGGQLVVLDRLGRDVKRYPLAHGLVTLGSDHSCDIRFMLDTVSLHHATVAVHTNQTVVRSVCSGETQVNGRGVSVAALRHGDVLSIGGRQLRWDYADPAARRPQAPLPALYVSSGAGAGGAGRARRAARRGTVAAGARRDPALQLALEMSHRASMPANAGGKQVAIVQPQRRDTNDQNDKPSPRTPLQNNKRLRTSKNELDISANEAEVDSAKRKSDTRASIKTPVTNLQNTTKATLWIESRKTSPRKSVKSQSPQYVVNIRRNTLSAKKSTPLRLAVLKRAQSAHKIKVTKIEEPRTIDHTKQAAILLMTGHTPKSKLLGQKTPSPKSSTPQQESPKAAAPKSASPKAGGRRSASFVVKKKSPVRKSTPRGRRSRASVVSTTPQDRTVTILEITDSDGRDSTLRSSSRHSGQTSSTKSVLLQSPRKSSLKDPLAKKSMRKTESIKFDLSNLENYSHASDVMTVTDTTRQSERDTVTDEDVTLHYDTSLSPSPRRSIHSRTSRMLASLGTTSPAHAASPPPSRTLTPASPRPRKSSRASVMLQNSLNKSDATLPPSRRSPGRRTRTLSPRSPRDTLESYSIVDLVSIDSNESGRSTSVYNSAGSTNNTTFGTPRTTARMTRSTINPALVDSSTPYVKAARSSAPRSRSTPDTSNKSWSSSSRLTTKSSVSTRRTKSVSTPQNSIKRDSVNSTRMSRVSRSRSRINDSDLMLVEPDEADDSPRSSKRVSTVSKRSSSSSQNKTATDSPGENEGTSTPENRHSPEEASTPVLSIQSLLDSSQSSAPSQSSKGRGRSSFKRKTIGVLSIPKAKVSTRSKSLNLSTRKTRLRLSSDSYENMNVSVQQDGEIVTPKSAVKLVQEAVKNKHSTAKKPQSKRSIIDDLNESDIVKQLFNSPVKRKLSQSMTEFSKRQLFDDDDEVQVRRPTRNTVALTGRTPDQSLLDHTEAFTPERFVSPISTPSNSPNLAGIKLMFAKTTPKNDLRNVRGVKALLRTPRARKSIRNDLTDVAGVKMMFAKSPRNRLSDVRVKQVFASSPKNDLRRVSGVKSLFQSQQEKKSPLNSLDDVRGVKKLFNRKSPANDLTHVSGVKKTLRMFRGDKRESELNDLSGVEELFNESNQSHQSHRDAESLFDQLVGKPTIKAVYSKTFSAKSAQKKIRRSMKSLHASLDVITNNVEQWLEQELHKRLHKEVTKSANKSKANLTRELQKLATDTVEGTAPIRTSRVRNSNVSVTTSLTEGTKRQKSASELYSAHTLPIKKRSFVDASLEKSKNDSKPIYLPIKKRAVVHSTPVKGRQVNMTMNASELGRVSPIVADTTQHLDHHVSRSNKAKPPVEARPKNRRGTTAPPKSPIFTKPSPKSTRGNTKLPTPVKAKPATPTKDKSPAKSKSPSPKKPVSPVTKLTTPKTTRSRRTVAVSPQAETKKLKRGSTLVVAKKSPVMSPQPRAARKRKQPETLPTPTASPKRTRATRNKDEKVKVVEKLKTPKNTRAKVQKATVVIVKPSPQIKPRATRGKALQSDKVASKVKKADNKKVNNKKVESPKISPPAKKAVKDVTVELVPKTRGRKVAATHDVPKESSAKVAKAQPKTKRGRGNTTVEEEPVVSRKTRKADKEQPASVEPKAKPTRGQKQEVPVEETKKTRGKKVVVVAQESVQSEPSTRSRRGTKLDNSALPEVNTRKRKTTATDDDRPTKVSKKKEAAETRGRNKKVESTKTESPPSAATKKAVAKESKEKIRATGDVPKKSTRSKKAEVSVEAPKQEEKRPARGKKTAVVEAVAAPEVGKRKRKPALESPPVEVADISKKLRGAKKPAPARARNTRSVATTEVSKSGRSRRR